MLGENIGSKESETIVKREDNKLYLVTVFVREWTDADCLELNDQKAKALSFTYDPAPTVSRVDALLAQEAAAKSS